jgi:hypothetical protein
VVVPDLHDRVGEDCDGHGGVLFVRLVISAGRATSATAAARRAA